LKAEGGEEEEKKSEEPTVVLDEEFAQAPFLSFVLSKLTPTEYEKV